jgi:hypothetical protein
MMAANPEVTVDFENLRQVVRAIRAADKEVASSLRKEFRTIANRILPQVRAEGAGNVPRRFASKTKSMYQAGVDSDRVYIKIPRARTGPGQIARIFEIGSARNRGYIRHPLWPRPETPRASWRWSEVRQPTRPSVQPVLDRNRDWLRRDFEKAVRDACEKAGVRVKAR